MEIPAEARADARVGRSLEGESIVFAVRGRRMHGGQVLAFSTVGLFLVAIGWTLWTTDPATPRAFPVLFGAIGLGMVGHALHGAFSRVWFVGTPSRLLVVGRRSAAWPWSGFAEEATLVHGARGSVFLRAWAPGRLHASVRAKDMPEDADDALAVVALRGVPDPAGVARAALRLIAGEPPAAPAGPPSPEGPRPTPAVEALLGGQAPGLAVPTRGPVEGRGAAFLMAAVCGGIALIMASILRLLLAGDPWAGEGPAAVGGGVAVAAASDADPVNAPLMLLFFGLFIVPLAAGSIVGLWKAVTARRHVWIAREGLVLARGREARLVRWARVVGLDARGRQVVLTLSSPAAVPGSSMPPARIALSGLDDAEAVAAAVAAHRGPLPAVLG